MSRAQSLAAAAILSTLASACVGGDVPAPGGASGPVQSPAEAPVADAHEVFVVAHQDDDLLFMSPDIGRAIHDPEPVATVYLTAGDSGRTDDAYYVEREVGVMAAYAELATVADPHWTEERLALHGHDVLVRRMREVDVSIAFLRLPDGNGDGAGYGTSLGTAGGSLAKLWDRRIPSLRAVDGSATYDRDELVDTLSELFRHFRASRIDALDGTNAFGFDHSDHVHAGLFTQEAAPPTATLRFYRGYNIRDEVTNLNSDEVQTKWAAFGKYMQHDAAICRGGQCDATIVNGYESFASRQYVVEAAPAFAGPLANANGLCLDVSGVDLVTTKCAGVASQRFRVSKDGLLRATDGRCLAGGAAGALLAPCTTTIDDSVLERWSLLSGGNLMNVDGRCLSGGAERQRVSLGRCDRSPRSQWTARFTPEKVRMYGDGFAPSHLFIVDVDADGHADLCARAAEGIRCASADATGSFGIPAVASADFDDAHGWSDAALAGTIHAVDVNHDGKIDFCGLASAGVLCARGLGGGRFGAATVVSRALDFQGIQEGSFTMGDVDGDGIVDACARARGDVRCALGDGTGALLGSTVWLPARALAHVPEVAGSHWALADVNGDGYADVCRVGADGIVCATAHRHRKGFERLRRWLGPAGAAFQPDTVVFGDVDGDRASDVCALSDKSVQCATSTGSSFSALLVRVPGFPEDSSWSNGHLALGDLDGDHRADACRWTDTAVTCATAP